MKRGGSRCSRSPSRARDRGPRGAGGAAGCSLPAAGCAERGPAAALALAVPSRAAGAGPAHGWGQRDSQPDGQRGAGAGPRPSRGNPQRFLPLLLPGFAFPASPGFLPAPRIAGGIAAFPALFSGCFLSPRSSSGSGHRQVRSARSCRVLPCLLGQLLLAPRCEAPIPSPLPGGGLNCTQINFFSSCCVLRV